METFLFWLPVVAVGVALLAIRLRNCELFILTIEISLEGWPSKEMSQSFSFRSSKIAKSSWPWSSQALSARAQCKKDPLRRNDDPHVDAKFWTLNDARPSPHVYSLSSSTTRSAYCNSMACVY